MNLNLAANNYDFFVPDGKSIDLALQRTTHLAVAAHQDDIELMAYHGIAECYQKSDKYFGAVVLSDGAGSPRTGKFANCTDEDMKKIRRQEQRDAATLGEYSFILQLNYPSSAIKDPHQDGPREDLAKVFASLHPQTVYLHNIVDKHPTHLGTVLRCIDALRACKDHHLPERILGMEVWRNLDWLNDDQKIILDTSPYPELARKLITVFDSQVSGGKSYDAAVIGRRLANATFGESHAVDKVTSSNFALDLKPLITDPQLTPALYAQQKIQDFMAAATGLIQKLS